MSLSNKRVVIIGGSSGIGLGIAKSSAEQGATIVIASRAEAKLSNAADEIGGDVTTYVLDAADEAAVEAFFDEIGEFDHLITPGSNATMAPLATQDTAVARDGFDSKFWGQYFAAKFGSPYIRPGGSIILFSGISSHKPPNGGTLPAALNSAVEGLGRALAVELAPTRVNIISPGLINTPVYEQMTDQDRTAMFNAVSSMVAVGRVGTPADIATAALYLMANEYSTGNTLFIDGGLTLK